MPSLSEAIVKLPPQSAITLSARSRILSSMLRRLGARSRFVMLSVTLYQLASYPITTGGMPSSALVIDGSIAISRNLLCSSPSDDKIYHQMSIVEAKALMEPSSMAIPASAIHPTGRYRLRSENLQTALPRCNESRSRFWGERRSITLGTSASVSGQAPGQRLRILPFPPPGRPTCCSTYRISSWRPPVPGSVSIPRRERPMDAPPSVGPGVGQCVTSGMNARLGQFCQNI